MEINISKIPFLKIPISMATKKISAKILSLSHLTQSQQINQSP